MDGEAAMSKQNTLIPRMGNKQYAWKHIKGYITTRASFSKLYCEPFLGSGYVFLRVKEAYPDQYCLLGDLNDQIGNFYLQLFYNEHFQEALQHLPYSEGLFKYLLGYDGDDDEVRAMQTYYKSKTAIMGGSSMREGNSNNIGAAKMLLGRDGGRHSGQSAKMFIRNSNKYAPKPKMEKMDSLFYRSQFLHKDFNATIDLATKRFGDDVFYYCDPPYFETEAVYGMPPFDHAGLRQALEGKNCMVSYDDCEYIRNLYEGWDIVDIEVSKQSMKGGKKIRKEILIMSHDNSINEI